MTREQLDLIPDHLLNRRQGEACRDLIEWLYARGWQMTLLELHEERLRRWANERNGQ